jgi:hypothetical protein
MNNNKHFSRFGVLHHKELFIDLNCREHLVVMNGVVLLSLACFSISKFFQGRGFTQFGGENQIFVCVAHFV